MSSLIGSQDRDNINKTSTMATPNVSHPFGLDTDGGIPSQMKHMGGLEVLSSLTR